MFRSAQCTGQTVNHSILTSLFSLVLCHTCIRFSCGISVAFAS